MNLSRRIWHIGTVVSLLLLLLSVRLVYWQLWRADDLQPPIYNPLGGGLSGERLLKALDEDGLDDLQSLPQPVRQRTLALLDNITRGAIRDRNGRLLAYNVALPDGGERRFYSEPSLAPVVGYVSAVGLGVSGAEEAFNESLLGLNRLDGQLNRLLHQPLVGSDVYLTIDSAVQRTAAQAMAGQAGAIVALDGNSGAVLAMVSTPTFDPNRILENEYLAGVLACTQPACDGALLSRATHGLYVPGSTWKTVTLAAALDTGQVSSDTVFDFGQQRSSGGRSYYVYEVDGFEIVDPNHQQSQLDLLGTYRYSANAAYARMADEMPPATFLEYAARFGFSSPLGAPPLEIGARPSLVANEPDALLTNNVLRASSGFGQGEIQTTPLNMSLIVAALVNNGDMPRPHVLLQTVDPSGDTIATPDTSPWRTDVVRPETAQQVMQMMAQIVALGSGGAASVPGLTVGGKTGTAQLGGDLAPHAWFIGYASNGERTVVIAVVVENGGSGGLVAAPLFAQVADAALNHLGDPVEEIVAPPQ